MACMDRVEILRRPPPETVQTPLPVWMRVARETSGKTTTTTRREGVVAFFGRPRLPGGEEHLLKAAFIAAKRRPELRFRIALHNCAALDLADRLARFGLDRCTVATDPTGMSLPELAASANLLVLESLPDGVSLKDVGTLAQRLPIVLNRRYDLGSSDQLPANVLRLDFWDARSMADAILYQLDSVKKATRRRRSGPLSQKARKSQIAGWR